MSGSNTLQGGGGGGDGVGGGGGPCGACKFLRRKCTRGCIFAPHFDPEGGAVHFAAVHRVFGASNASKLLQRVPTHRRHHAVLALCYEAHARLRDPVYGCVAHILALQHQVVSLEAEIALVHARISPLNNNNSNSKKCSPPPPTSSDVLPPAVPTSMAAMFEEYYDPFQLRPFQEDEEEVEGFAEDCLREYLQEGKCHWQSSR